MSASIEAHLELKIGGEWLYQDQLFIDPFPNMFTKLVGLFSEDNDGIEPIAKDRGLPDDVSKMLKFHLDYHDTDNYSHSWLNAEEIYCFVKWCEKVMNLRPGPHWFVNIGPTFPSPSFGTYLFGGYVESFYEHPDDRPEGLEDIRMIFWFN